MQQQTLLNWLALLRAPNLTPKKFYQLVNCYPDLSSVFSAAVDLTSFQLHENTLTYLQQPDWTGAEHDLTWANQPQHHIVSYLDEHYPPLLKEIASPPPILFVQGQLHNITTAQLAMIGSRNPTQAGQEIAYNFSAQLAQQGLTITSGLALGIDAASHRGALSTTGTTIAVLGTGLDIIYPRSHTKLAQQIADRGALVSEFPIGTRPHAWHFPQRNRIISGLSLGTLIVEATLKSGSLITAKYAMEQNREVFAIPGSIHNPLARGCHSMLRQGAKLVETLQDIYEEFSHLFSQTLPAKTSSNSATTINSEQADLLALLDFSPCTLDKLILRSRLTTAQVSAMLLELEILGYVENILGNYVRIK